MGVSKFRHVVSTETRLIKIMRLVVELIESEGMWHKRAVNQLYLTGLFTVTITLGGILYFLPREHQGNAIIVALVATLLWWLFQYFLVMRTKPWQELEQHIKAYDFECAETKLTLERFVLSQGGLDLKKARYVLELEKSKLQEKNKKR